MVGVYSGDGGPATASQLRRPLAVASAPNGSLYIADSRNGLVRRVGASGVITTVVGGQRALFTDGALATSVDVGPPWQLQLHATGGARPHQGLDQCGPDPNPAVVQLPVVGRIIRQDRLGGLLHEYAWAA